MEMAVPDPAVNPEYTEMEPAVPDWLYRKIRNRKTEDRNRNWWMEVEPDILCQEDGCYLNLFVFDTGKSGIGRLKTGTGTGGWK